MANYFRKTIKLDEGCLHRREIFIDCKRYVSKDRRWRFGVTNPLVTRSYDQFMPGTYIVGDRATIQRALSQFLCEYTATE